MAAKQQAAVNAQLLVGSSGTAPEAGGLQLRVRPQGKVSGAAAAAAGAGGKGDAAGKPGNAVAAAAAAALIKEFSTSAGPRVDGGKAGGGGPVMVSWKQRAAGLAADLAADAKVAEDMALLAAASDRRSAMELDDDDLGGTGGGDAAVARRKKQQEGDAVVPAWVPPSNQRGDGRTALNDKLGY